jgi:hypothetical protein
VSDAANVNAISRLDLEVAVRTSSLGQTSAAAPSLLMDSLKIVVVEL